MKSTQTRNLLLTLLEAARQLGLPIKDIALAETALNANEGEVCFDTITNQLYEYDIELDQMTLHLILYTSKVMNLPKEDYAFLKELVRPESKLTETLAKKIQEMTQT